MILLTDILRESWQILLDSAVFVLFGLFVAGLLKSFLPDDMVARHLGGNRFRGILKAALFGIPIPL